MRLFWLKALPLTAVMLSVSAYASDRPHRSQSAKREFAQTHPCPSTGERKPSCPGYVLDHVVPLCAGGEDAPFNLQWQEREESLVKDREERRLCARLRRERLGD